MTETKTTAKGETAANRPACQQPVLDEAKRTQILALVASECSRRVAARFVGCAPSTITRTAPPFEARNLPLESAA